MRLIIVTNRPAHAAKATGDRLTSMPSGTAGAKKWSITRSKRESPSWMESVAPTTSTTGECATPHAYRGMASARPARGPEAPMSSSARRVGMVERMRMTAPIVPNGETSGIGMK